MTEIIHQRLEENGHIPLPPYIDREDEALDREMYQTVYSREEGSVASPPTAGLHFTEELLDEVQRKGREDGVCDASCGNRHRTRPVKCDVVEDHHMHFEEYSVTQREQQISSTRRKKPEAASPFRWAPHPVQRRWRVPVWKTERYWPAAAVREFSSIPDIASRWSML